MSEVDWVAAVFRWMHLLGAIVAVGGAVYVKWVVQPVARDVLDADAAARFRERAAARWRMPLHLAITALLVSGIYQFVTLGLSVEGAARGAYHGLFGLKFLLAFVVFFLASALAGRAAAFRGIRDNAGKWVAVTVTFALAIVILSGVLRGLRG